MNSKYIIYISSKGRCLKDIITRSSSWNSSCLNRTLTRRLTIWSFYEVHLFQDGLYHKSFEKD